MNELSLNGQFFSIDNFIENAVRPIVAVLNEVDYSQDLLYKKYDFYASMVTPQTNLHAIVQGSVSRQFDELRKFKSQLASLFEDPYWENNPKHSQNDSYFHAETRITGSSLAEAFERDCVVISFVSCDFKDRKITISKNLERFQIIDNLFDAGHYNLLIRERGILADFTLANRSKFARTRFIRQGQTVFKEIETGNYWYLDNFHKNHFEVFDGNKNHLGEADLSGTIDYSKREEGRKL